MAWKNQTVGGLRDQGAPSLAHLGVFVAEVGSFACSQPREPEEGRPGGTGNQKSGSSQRCLEARPARTGEMHE